MTNEKLSESSTDYFAGYECSMCGLILTGHTEWYLHTTGAQCQKPKKDCRHGVYKVQKVGNQWQIVCSKCESTHISPEELDEISEWMNSLCRGA